MLLHTVRWLWSEDQRMLFTVVMIRLRFNTFRSESPEADTAKLRNLSPGVRSASCASRQSETMQIAEQSPSDKCGQWFGNGDRGDHGRRRPVQGSNE